MTPDTSGRREVKGNCEAPGCSSKGTTIFNVMNEKVGQQVYVVCDRHAIIESDGTTVFS